MFASIATSAGVAPPGNAVWILSSAGTVAMLFGRASRPVWAVWMCSTGRASATRTAAEPIAVTSGWRRAGFSTMAQTRFSPRSRRSRPMNGIRPRLTLSPSRESSAGRTVSEPSIATATTIMVAIPNERYVLSPENSIPAIATITVRPEMSTERPEVAAAASIAARVLLPAARSSRSRLR